MLPWFLVNQICEEGCKNATLLFTNVPGPRENWHFTGKRCNAFGFSAALIRTSALMWHAITHGNVMKVSVTADRAAVKDIDWLMDQFTAILDETMLSSD